MQKSVENQPSETAMATAMLRALASLEGRGGDSMAELFLSQDRRNGLKDPSFRERVKHRIPGMYEFMIARTAFFDGIVERALREDIPQVVFLGAGYDTRPYRFRSLIGNTGIFELDVHTTQERKKELLREANIPIPERLTFISINFKTEGIGNALAAKGFDRALKTLFVWEGVTYYLSADVIDHTLHAVRSNSPANSSICFDYGSLSADALGDENVRKLRLAMRSRYAAEPTHFGIRDGEIGAFLAERGYRITLHLTAAEMEERYLSPVFPEKVPPLFCLVQAETVDPAG